MPVLQDQSFEGASVLLAIEHSAGAQLLADQLGRRDVQTERVQNGNDALDAIEDAGYEPTKLSLVTR